MQNVGTREDTSIFQLRGKDDAVYVARNFANETMLGWQWDSSDYSIGCDFNDDATVYLFGNKSEETFSKNGHYIYWWNQTADDRCGISADDSSPSQKYHLFHLLTSAFSLDGTTSSVENVIEDFASTSQNYSLLGRTFSSTNWNTLCLPFSMTAKQITASFGDGVELYECQSINEDGGITNFVFSKTSIITAGKAYLIKPSSDITDPLFAHVTITATTPTSPEGSAFIG